MLSRVTAADKCLILLACITLGFLINTFWASSAEATHLEISQGNHVIHLLPLNEHSETVVSGSLGDSVIEVNQGQARFLSAPCRNQVCIHKGWLSETNHIAACLPNRVVIRMVSSP